MKLSELTSVLTAALIDGEETEVMGLTSDSRRVKPGDLFICLPGHTVDGHDYAAEAVKRGAAALVVNHRMDLPVTQVIVRDCKFALAALADAFYGQPSHTMTMIGVTGTNGKTTTTTLISKILNDFGLPTGLIGTIGMTYGGHTYPMSCTTPDALELQHSLSEMSRSGTQMCVMEVSSHALEQGRVKGTHFRTAVFTNLTQDHLDYHQSLQEYRSAKGLFFSRLGNAFDKDPKRRKYAVLNVDDEASRVFSKLTAAEIITYGIHHDADVRASRIQIGAQGTSFHVETFCGSADIKLKLIGNFNVYNTLAAITAALIEGVPLSFIQQSLETVSGVEGRVESVDEGQPYSVIVDYAHTPDGLENVLKTVKEIAAHRILTVFGCGGDRDRSKRPVMGRIAAQWSDMVFITSDNPRSEDPEQILKDIEKGLIEDNVPAERYLLIEDRREAIKKAIEMASPGDVVLIAGKGHETYQLIGGKVLDFDDRIVAKEAIRGRQ
ncbi:UDP-N-acetylmuramoyl-L-alanyl-D-glutamate--2,6-diaminopimelate ligase [Paenibacillus lemnae]|uniref:UDP-N-acetylmuramoyl-L-alanyl-D-glutamate--2,6-diaminopimelate ligase n=1 Tax=Paenibacillus lemnae TaxID=1330551 RepID=A0A848M3G4_PAELE|nr:UDP-N-acetylmuramoyl-L-alanyl-D-glutamate--2,6-diaminopimelate ligase [Paenibacillus lemnae]NMO94781.1 UDP-N-acetylmuramoyl-L-alanyl-D-glutamate--2,6-diaminopimelate ligase [Paenibacillus lemnae]